MAKRLQGTDRNVWVEFSKLAVESKSLNLGQGFPDFMPPKYMQDALLTVASSDSPFMNQYTRGYGHPRLTQALSDTFSPIVGQNIDPNTDVIVTVGAYGALFYCVQGLVNPGDEVIIIEPFFDCYSPMVTVAGGVPVYVPLRPVACVEGGVQSSASWKLDMDELSSKFSSKTKAIFLNNPNNPSGKVFNAEELEGIGELCKKHDVLVFADEVYEWLVYKPKSLVKMASLPGMWDRTITIGSAGKTFSVTGWKLGWAFGPQHLIHALQTVHQNCVYTCATNLQEAVAMGLELERGRMDHPDCYFHSLPADLEPKRDRMADMLTMVGMKPIIPEGGYFMLADFSGLNVDYEDGTNDLKDYKFVRWLMKTKGVATIPPTAFYSEQHRHLAENLVRFCFVKHDATLDKAASIFQKWKDNY